MQGDKLVMSRKERQRKVILSSVVSGDFNLKEASERLGVSYRQVKRIYRSYVLEEDEGLVHKNRGRKPGYAFSEEFKGKVLKRYQSRYEGFGPTLACEKLVEEGYELS